MEKKAIMVEVISESQEVSSLKKRIIDNLGLDFQKSKKLVLTLAEKSNYVIHYKSLQFYLRQGMRFKMVHRVIEFEQEPYIQMNTEFRKAAETNFYKLMNNSVLSKTMTNRIDVKIVCSRETDKICSLLYARREIFGNDLVGINMH